MDKRVLFCKTAYLATTASIFLLDQVTKAWAARKLRFGGDVVIIQDFFNLTYTENTGVAFSLFNNYGDSGRWVLSAVAFLAAVLVTYFFWRTPRSDDRILGALTLFLAGILGNLVDRVRLGFVIDFIDFQFGAWHYPTFNIADIAICAGAGLFILDILLSDERKNKKYKKDESRNEKE